MKLIKLIKRIYSDKCACPSAPMAFTYGIGFVLVGIVCLCLPWETLFGRLFFGLFILGIGIFLTIAGIVLSKGDE